MKKTTLLLLLSLTLAFPHSVLWAGSAKAGATGSGWSTNASGSVTNSFDDATKDLRTRDSEAPVTRGGSAQQGTPLGIYGQNPQGMPGQGGQDIAKIINGVWRVQFSGYGGSTVSDVRWRYDPRSNTLSDGQTEMQAYTSGNVLHASGNNTSGAPMVLELQFISPNEAVGRGMIGTSQFGPASQLSIHMVKIG